MERLQTLGPAGIDEAIGEAPDREASEQQMTQMESEPKTSSDSASDGSMESVDRF